MKQMVNDAKVNMEKDANEATTAEEEEAPAAEDEDLAFDDLEAYFKMHLTIPSQV